jgi:predicted secreted hydrolase
VLKLDDQIQAQEFARAIDPVDFEFPRDHGPHFDYQTEWWYYTGNLTSEDGSQFGFQFTIFRRGLSPGAPPKVEGLSTNQVYFAHLALTDAASQRHYYDERFSRGAGGLAGAKAEPFGLRVEDWSVAAVDDGAEHVLIKAATEEFELDLNLEAVKPIVKHGNEGLSAKSKEVGNASYYLSYTRMRTSGELQVGERSFSVSGLSWFDHEWSTSVLGEGAVGWDWFGLQLDDGRELMLYYIRLSDGMIDPISGGTYIDAEGQTLSLNLSDMRIQSLETWTSAESGVSYPSGWQISLPSLGIELTVEPLIDDQEMRVSFTYWEGAVQVSGVQDGTTFTGSGYVELTGYFESMEGVLS